MKRNNGFTLIELMIAVAIIGILSAVAIPAYSDYLLRGKLAEAFTWLAGTRVTLEQYYQDNRHYGSAAGACVTPMPADPAVKYFTFSCTWGASGTDQSYVITATGITAQGTGGFSYTINETNTKATTGVPAGWTTNAACWVTKKGGTC